MTTKPTERDLIEEVEGLLAKATPGPWQAQRNPDKRAGLCVRAPKSARPSAPNPAVCRVYDVLKEREANAALIAAAPDLLRCLVAEVTLLRREIITFASSESELNDIHACDKCDLCEDHHA